MKDREKIDFIMPHSDQNLCPSASKHALNEQSTAYGKCV